MPVSPRELDSEVESAGLFSKRNLAIFEWCDY